MLGVASIFSLSRRATESVTFFSWLPPVLVAIFFKPETIVPALLIMGTGWFIDKSRAGGGRAAGAGRHRPRGRTPRWRPAVRPAPSRRSPQVPPLS